VRNRRAEHGHDLFRSIDPKIVRRAVKPNSTLPPIEMSIGTGLRRQLERTGHRFKHAEMRDESLTFATSREYKDRSGILDVFTVDVANWVSRWQSEK
jgi:hypothetical protein